MSLSEKERLELLLKIRWAEDPCRMMELTPSQKQADECTARYIAVKGQTRGGKTAFSAKKLATIARRIPDCKTTSITGVYIVFAPSRDQISDPWGKKLLVSSELKGELFEKPFIPSYEIESTNYTYGAGEPTIKQITLKNGNKILFCVSGDKNVWKRIEGKGMILGIVFDESAGSEQLLTESASRLLDANSNEIIRREAGGAWIVWAATQTKKSPAFERFLAICQSGQDPDYAAFTLSPNENPAIDVAEREKMATILSKEEYEIRMLGHGSAAGAMALYPQWDDDRNQAPVGQEYVPGPDDNLWWFLDPGVQYTGMVIAAINRLYPQRLNIVAVWQPQRCTLKTCVQIVRDWLGGRKLEGIVYDQAARKGHQVGRSLISELLTLIGQKGTDIYAHRSAIMGRSEYKATVPLVRRYLRCENGDEGYPTNLILNRESGCSLLRWQILNCAFTDKAYELKEENVSKGNDHCLSAGTKILTPLGYRDIEALRPGDLITNRFGDFPVLLTLKTEIRPVMELVFEGGSIIATGNHKMLTDGGWQRIDNICTSDMLMSWTPSNSSESPTADTPTQNIAICGSTTEARSQEKQEGRSYCTGPSGVTHTGQFPLDVTSIIETEMQTITTSPIWNAWLQQITSHNTCGRDWQTQNSEQNTPCGLPAPLPLHQSGTPAQRAWHGTQSTAENAWPNESQWNSSAATAGNHLLPKRIVADSAAITANQHGDERAASTTCSAFASSAAKNSPSIATRETSCVPVRVLRLTALEDRKDVYTITVLGPSEYIANHCVTMNCSDALRYGISRKPGWVDRGANPKIWGLGTNGVDPDSTRTDHGDTTVADHAVAARPFVAVETESPAARQRRKEASSREKRIKQMRTVW